MKKLRVASTDGSIVLYAPERITLGENSNALREGIKALNAAGFSKIILDFSNTSFIDSAGLGTLVAGHHIVKLGGGALSLNALSKSFTEVLEITKLDSIFNFNKQPLGKLRVVEFEGNDISGIKLAQSLPLILTLREKRIHVELGIREGVYKVQCDQDAQNSNVIIASPYAIAEATHTLLSDDVKEFEELINSLDTSEGDIHLFMEQHPRILLAREYRELHSKVLLERQIEGPLIPDFMLEPFDKELCDLLDLKLPTERLLVGTANRRRFSGAVHEAVAQLRKYRDYFEDKMRREEIFRRYKIKAYRPRMTVIIGRAHSIDPVEYRQIVEGQKDVKVMTYDDLLARAKRFLIV